MSKISLKHSGGNVVSLNSPTSAPTSADVAFKLPNQDGSANEVLKTDGSGNLGFVAQGLAGITEFDMWYAHTNHSADASSAILGVSGSSTINRHTSMSNPVAQAAQIGTGMTLDSSTGIFTFPNTGKYLVINNPQIFVYGSDNAGVFTQVSTDGGSNFESAALPYIGNSSGNNIHSGVAFSFVDVTNTSNIKVRFKTDSLGTNSYVIGNSSYARTMFLFIRIGDT